MDADLISYEAMLAAKEAANWAWWTMVAAIATVFISLATLGFAYTALNSWIEQERLKLKMEFKRAVLELKYSLKNMPEDWSYLNINVAKARLKIDPSLINRIGDESHIYFRKEELIVSYDNAVKSWVLCGHLFSETDVEDCWRKVNDIFRQYKLTGGNKAVLERLIDSLCLKLKIL